MCKEHAQCRKKSDKLSSQEAATFGVLPAMNKSFLSLPVFAVVNVLDFGHYNMYGVVSLLEIAFFC